jgi:predicted O-methyltransferase YrrM
MARRSIQLTEKLEGYLQKVSLREPEVLRRLREETAKMPLAGMQISPEQGQFMALLVRLIGARRYLEVGTFTGYSALAVALALPQDGKVVACDVSREWTAVGERYWREADMARKIDLRIAPALETLDALIAAKAPAFDFAFIDADKVSYPDYYEHSLRLLRANGLIMLDNTLREGTGLDPQEGDEGTATMARLNDRIASDDRVDVAMLGIADGVTLVRKH